MQYRNGAATPWNTRWKKNGGMIDSKGVETVITRVRELEEVV